MQTCSTRRGMRSTGSKHTGKGGQRRDSRTQRNRRALRTRPKPKSQPYPGSSSRRLYRGPPHTKPTGLAPYKHNRPERGMHRGRNNSRGNRRPQPTHRGLQDHSQQHRGVPGGRRSRSSNASSSSSNSQDSSRRSWRRSGNTSAHKHESKLKRRAGDGGKHQQTNPENSGTKNSPSSNAEKDAKKYLSRSRS